MRKYARSWFIFLAIGAIVVVFIFWGIGGFRSPRFEQVATVNGTPIWLPAYIKAYQNLLQSYRQKLGDEASEELIKALHVREQALNLLIEEQLILQAAQRLGITVSTSELQGHITQYPAFHDEQGFSKQRYFMVLERLRLSPADFEAQERQSLLIQKTIALVTSFAKVSDAELREIYRLQHEAVEVEYLVVSPDRFLGSQTASEAEITAYYRAHREEWRVPARVRVRYLLVQNRDYLSKVQLTPEKLEAYYQEHEQEFARPKTIRVRQLLLREPKGAAARERRQKQALELLQRARAGEDFAKLVRTYSQDKASRNQGGDLGYISRGKGLPAWEKVAFNLKAGQIGLAHTTQGYHIIRVEEIKESEVPPLADIRNQVESRCREHQARKLAQDAAQQIRAELATASMTEVAARHQLRVKETPFLGPQDPVPGLGRYSQFNQLALHLKPQEISRVERLPIGFVILQGLERRESHIPPLNQIRARVSQAVKSQKAAAQAANVARELLARLKKDEAFDRVAAQAGLPIHTSGFFTRTQGFPGKAENYSITQAAFLLSPDHPYPPEPITAQGTSYLLKYKARRVPSAEEFEKARDHLYRNLLEQKRQLLFSQWLAAERQRADIKVFELPS